MGIHLIEQADPRSPVPPLNGFAQFSELPLEPARERLLTCLNAPGWADAVLAGRPYPDAGSLLDAVLRLGRELSDDDLRQALAKHPRIGERPAGSSPEAAHSRSEQSGVDQTDAELTAALHAGNLAYEKKFDQVFLIRAAGRTGPEILEALRERLTNDPQTEAAVVRDQLAQIAQLRLAAQLAAQITLSTHVLDSGTGRPAVGVSVALDGPEGRLATAVTDQDGRVREWGSDVIVRPGTFRLTFGTGEWFEQQGQECYNPEVTVTFVIPEGDGHFHVPLLLSAYAYSTYRGS